MNKIKYLFISIILIFALLTLASCTDAGNEEHTTVNAPEVISGEEVSTNESASEGEIESDTTAEEVTTMPEEETTGSVLLYSKSGLPDYTEYLNEKNIKKALTGTDTLVIALNGAKAWYKDGFVKADAKTVVKNKGVLSVNGEKVGHILGSTVTGSTAEAVADSLGMNFAVYEKKMILFYKGTESPLDLFNDYYTLEALYLELTEADETEKINAFIDLPSVISNGRNSAVFYTLPDISLAVQTNIYYSQLGDNDAVATGPAIVAGEGRNPENHTLVRVLNRQQICTAQFLAFDSSVTGGVQVSAGLTSSGETLIATAAYDTTVDSAKCINVFNQDGVKRTVIRPDTRIEAPYRIMTGNFLKGTENELLLITSSKPQSDNYIYFALYELDTGELVKIFRIDCSFAGGSEIQLSIRENSDKADGIIVYFEAARIAYEGDADTTQFDWTGIQLPLNAAGVYASASESQKYLVSLKMTDDTLNQSFIRVYDSKNSDMGKALDVGFKENVYYSSKAADNNYAYVDNCSFQHIRADISNSARGKLNSISDENKFDDTVLTLKYDDYCFSGISGYQSKYKSQNVMLEPCFTHRWNGGTFNNFVAYTNENGDHIYSALGSSGEYKVYEELGSNFDNGTYADGLLVLEKIRIYPLRTFTRALAETVRGKNGNTANLIGISPVHEQEINVDGSVGDYNVNMVKGFAKFLVGQYGSVENINQRFGTSFTSVDNIDAPRNNGRGEWDNLKGKKVSEYAQQWTLYCRNIINKRIMEAYRETLLAGFAPETISSHQIPEGDAVSGLLGQADTRLSPVDVVMSCGTAYGSTRYGIFYNDKNNFVALAHNAGHNSIELGEYSTANSNKKYAYKQLKYLWENGVRVNHIIAFDDSQYEAEQYAIDQLQEENLPRPGYTKGTDNILSVKQGDTSYNIIEIGQGDSSNGLLKSVTSDGQWEGTVYVVPFHSHVNVMSVGISESSKNVFTSEEISGLQNGDQIEFTFDAKYTGQGSAKAKIQVYQAGYLIEASVTEFVIGPELSNFRYVLSNQMSPEAVKVVITFTCDDDSQLTLGTINATLETESLGRKYFDGKQAINKSKAHVGGITFDLISRDMK